MLFAFRPDRLAIDDGRGEREKDAMIALTEIEKSADGGQALIPTELLV